LVEIDKNFQEEIKRSIRDVYDFPKEGIIFRDITTLLQNGLLFKKVLDYFYMFCEQNKAEAIIGVESRGFIFGGALAYNLQVPFIPVRKEGKLPYATLKESYSLEYGEATVEMHEDALVKGTNTIIIDDLLATGGTLKATTSLVEKCGGKVGGIALLVELSFLNGRDLLQDYEIFSLASYES